MADTLGARCLLGERFFFPALLLCLALSSGCATQHQLTAADLNFDAPLLDGRAFFGEPVHIGQYGAPDMLDIDTSMQRFVEREVTDVSMSVIRFRHLLEAMSDHGYFAGTYVGDVTQTAKDTFHNKRGNCLSYTSLFIVLAREAGLNANFQIVDVPPSWDADSEYVIRSNHINAVVQGMRFDKQHANSFTVDFNKVSMEADYDREVIKDEIAISLFHANLGVQRLQEGALKEGFAFLRSSIEHAPTHQDHWINLGAFYAKQNADDLARQAYSVALQIDATNKTANGALARVYTRQGQPDLAAKHQVLARRHRINNPFYHYGLAQREYDAKRYKHSLAAIDEALRLKRRIPRFHFLRALVQHKLGAVEQANRSVRRGMQLGHPGALAPRYREELAQLDRDSVFVSK